MEAHLKFAPSRAHAPKRDFAVASALLADVGRAAAGARSYDALADAIQELFARFESEPEPMLRWARTYPRAVLLTSVLAGATGRAQLRAARTLLGWTRGLAPPRSRAVMHARARARI